MNIFSIFTLQLLSKVSEYSNNLYKIVILPIISDMEGETLTEMADALGLPHRTIERRIQRAKIKPLTKEAVYPLGTLEKIRDKKMGRPKKAAEPVKPAVKAKKAKKA